MIQLFIASTQNQAKTQQNSEPGEVEKSAIGAQERENHQPNEGKSEKQSKTIGAHQSEKSETTHEEMADDEPMAANNRVEERESEEKNGGGPRERLKRHRTEVAGQVWIPDLWGQEELLMDWIDCSAFDASLMPQGIISARASLVEEGRRANSAGITVENSC